METTLINSKGIAFDAKKGRKVYTIGTGKNKRKIDVDFLKDVNTKEQFYACENDYELAITDQKIKEQEYLRMLKESCLALKTDGNVNGRFWEDSTTYSRDSRRLPTNFRLHLKSYTISISCDMLAEPNTWFFTSQITNPNPNPYNWARIGKVSAQQAAALAVEKVREYITELYEEIK